MKKLNLPEKELQKRLDVLNKYQTEIIKIWESNKHKRGYVELFIDNNYKPYGLKFIPKNVKKSSFVILKPAEEYALCEILWDNTDTKNRLAFGYSKANIPEIIMN